jgi:hypothetical protein
MADSKKPDPAAPPATELAQLLHAMREEWRQNQAATERRFEEMTTAHQAQITNLEMALRGAQDQTAGTHLGPAPNLPREAQIETGEPRRKPLLPELKIFEGERRNYRAWKLEAQAKLRTDGPLMGAPADCFSYIFSRLAQKVQTIVATYFGAGGSDGSYDPDDFFTYLDSIYIDQNASARAIDLLRTMRQGDRESFSTFLPRFERELADSGLGAAGDAVAISYLEGALNKRMREALVTVDRIDNYRLFAQKLYIISSRFDSL